MPPLSNPLFLSLAVLVSIFAASQAAYSTKRLNSRSDLEPQVSSDLNGFYQCLRSNPSSPTSRVVKPGDPGYDVSTLTFNLVIRHNASAIVYPASTADVSKAIKCATSFKVPVVGRGGGYSYASDSVIQDGLVIDVTQLNQVQFATNQAGTPGELVTIGAGIRIGDLALALDTHERAVGHGLAPGMAVSGHAACGGWGLSTRKHGLFTDQVTAMEVVTADGEVHTISDKEKPDLFFAMRGAGSSFGIITSLTMRTEAAPARVIKFSYTYDFPDAQTAAKVLQQYQTWGANSAPPELGIRFTIFPKTNSEKTKTAPTKFDLSGIYYGHSGRFEQIIHTLIDQFHIDETVLTIERLSWIDSVRALANTDDLSYVGKDPSNDNQAYYAKSHIVRESDQLSYEDWLKFTSAVYHRRPDFDYPPVFFKWFIEIDLIGGSYEGQPTAVKRLANSQSSFSPRDALLLFQMGGYGTRNDTLEVGPSMDLAQEFNGIIYESLGGGKKELSGFNCYVDAELSADQAHREYYGATTTEKLKAIKAQYDPQRVFQSPQGF